MPVIRNFEEAHQVLTAYIPTPSGMHTNTLSVITALLRVLDNPQEKFKVIHVAGTSGKTSTAYYMTALLMKSGTKVGLTVSPHTNEVNERAQINLVPMPEPQFCEALGEFIDIVTESGIEPSYFELMVAFAFWQFAKQRVDYAVVEVGVGGLLDATNVVKRSDKLCIITDIGFDHMHILGYTIPEISAQKAGIIQPGNRVFMHRQSHEVMEAVGARVEKQRADLRVMDQQDNEVLPGELVLFQRRNWYLARKAYDFLAGRDGLPMLSQEQLQSTTEIVIPGRMEMLERPGKIIILDGAHNSQKLAALAASVRQRFPNEPLALLLSFVKSESFSVRTAGLETILSLADHVIVTSFATVNDFGKDSVNPAEVAAQCVEAGFTDVEIVNDPLEAVEVLKQRPEKLVLVTGSFYLFNHIRPALNV